MTKSFSATIDIIGINPFVPVPDKILQFLLQQSGKKSCPIPVKGMINGKLFIQTVVKYAGLVRLYINGGMCQSANVKVGDVVKINLAYDPEPRVPSMPAKLKVAFSKNKVAQVIFDKFPPSHQREILKYLNSMKTELSLDRNIQKVIDYLLDKKVIGLQALMRRKISN